ncbi:MAG: hypothetical protein AMXMBFR7_43350 [Planctomycetota bacterium]
MPSRRAMNVLLLIVLLLAGLMLLGVVGRSVAFGFRLALRMVWAAGGLFLLALFLFLVLRSGSRND